MASTGICIHILICFATVIPGVELVKTYYMDDYCSRSISLGYTTYSVNVKSQASYYYSDNEDCTLKLAAPYGYRLSFYFESFDIGDCPNDYIEIRDGAYSFSRTLVSKACLFKPSRVETSGQKARIRFHTDSSSSFGTGFKLLVTVFKYGSCDSTELSCNDGKCINRDLCLDGDNNCGDFDFSDRSSCSPTPFTPTYVDYFWWVWMLIGLGVFIVVVSVIVAVVCCVCKNKRPGTVIQSGPMAGTTTYNTGTHAVTVQQGNPWYGNTGQTNLAYQPPAYTATSGTAMYAAPPAALTPEAPPSYTAVVGPATGPVPASVPPTNTEATEHKL